MKDHDFRCLVAKYFKAVDEWRRSRRDEVAKRVSRLEQRILEDNDKHFKRIEANRQMRIPM